VLCHLKVTQRLWATIRRHKTRRHKQDERSPIRRQYNTRQEHKTSCVVSPYGRLDLNITALCIIRRHKTRRQKQDERSPIRRITRRGDTHLVNTTGRPYGITLIRVCVHNTIRYTQDVLPMRNRMSDPSCLWATRINGINTLIRADTLVRADNHISSCR